MLDDVCIISVFKINIQGSGLAQDMDDINF
jgi:hypothetical protein